LSITGHEQELKSERAYIELLYGRLDAERAAAAGRLAGALLDSASTSHEVRWTREVSVDALSQRVSRLRVADNGLCFGRIDGRTGAGTYIGRIGLFDEDGEYESLLTDWRAPAARPFYCATGANPEGIAVRRHFHTHGREVLDFHDEVLDLEMAGNGEPDADAALLAALNAPREATMRDIVSTIQAEQDDVIRLAPAGVVVIEGGPGTGKTAVAMHRVAYLLYTERDRLSRRGVLVIGPNPGFLRYIGNVLPSLGETDVVFATPGELLPGLRATVEEPPAVRRVKGGFAMVGVLAAAVADRQELPRAPIEIELSDGPVPLDTALVAAARERARTSGLLHNHARGVFRDALVAGLVGRAVARIGAGWLAPEDVAALAREFTTDVRTELADSPELDAALDRLWPALTPQRLLGDLYGSRERLATAAATLPAADRALLYRDPGAPWTVSDVPLLDEALELLGEDQVTRELAAQEERERQRYAGKVLEMLTFDAEELDDGQVLSAVDLLDAGRLSERHGERDHRDLAERAAADREWTYGHVVVDEAQELSELDWRVLMRRCPSRSFTVVGDLAQRGSAAGARTWGAMLDRYVPGRWRYRELTVNYRTTAEIMAVAARVLAAVDPALHPPVSVRSGGAQPWARAVPPGGLAEAVAAAVREERQRVGAGSVAVIAPAALALPGALTPTAAKGLEFDAVLVVEPGPMLAAGPQGAAELYVALTRATQRLGVLHTTPLPAPLADLPPG
jgi:DNA helicase IV